MDVLELLKADHERMKDLLQKMLETDDGKERGRLFAEFKAELVAHSRAEEKILYRRLEKDEETRDEALEGYVEHEVAETLALSLEKARQKGSDKWKARCQVLSELLDHHVEEEEGEIFADARKQFSSEELEKMGEAFGKEKAKHGVPAADAA